MDFVNIEMTFHAKALEVYSQCFNNVAAIDIDEDIEVCCDVNILPLTNGVKKREIHM